MNGGEDYELLFAVGPRRRRLFHAVATRCGVPVTAVGKLTPEPGQWLSRQGRVEPMGQGFSHF
jgi:thiamine monophosphate kinase